MTTNGFVILFRDLALVKSNFASYVFVLLAHLAARNQMKGSLSITDLTCNA